MFCAFFAVVYNGVFLLYFLLYEDLSCFLLFFLLANSATSGGGGGSGGNQIAKWIRKRKEKTLVAWTPRRQPRVAAAAAAQFSVTGASLCHTLLLNGPPDL